MIDSSYRVSFIFAVALHVALLLFLVVKFTNSRSASFNPGANSINAVVINEHSISNQVNKVSQKVIKSHDVLQKNLLIEQSKEIAVLEKAKKIHQMNLVKKRQEKMQQILQDQLKNEQKQLMQEQSNMGSAAQLAGSGEVDKYKVMLRQAISSQWIVPDEVDIGATCQLLINVAPDGTVLNVQLLTSSGNIALDRAAQAAVLKASPLPVPQEYKLFSEFRTIKLNFNPQGIVSN